MTRTRGGAFTYNSLVAIAIVLAAGFGTARVAYASDAADPECAQGLYSCDWPNHEDGQTCYLNKPCQETVDGISISGVCTKQDVCHDTSVGGKAPALPSIPAQPDGTTQPPSSVTSNPASSGNGSPPASQNPTESSTNGSAPQDAAADTSASGHDASPQSGQAGQASTAGGTTAPTASQIGPADQNIQTLSPTDQPSTGSQEPAWMKDGSSQGAVQTSADTFLPPPSAAAPSPTPAPTFQNPFVWLTGDMNAPTYSISSGEGFEGLTIPDTQNLTLAATPGDPLDQSWTESPYSPGSQIQPSGPDNTPASVAAAQAEETPDLNSSAPSTLSTPTPTTGAIASDQPTAFGNTISNPSPIFDQTLAIAQQDQQYWYQQWSAAQALADSVKADPALTAQYAAQGINVSDLQDKADALYTDLDKATQNVSTLNAGITAYQDTGAIAPYLQNELDKIQAGEGAGSAALSDIVANSETAASDDLNNLKSAFTQPTIGNIAAAPLNAAAWVGDNFIGGVASAVNTQAQALGAPGFNPAPNTVIEDTGAPVTAGNANVRATVTLALLAADPALKLAGFGADLATGGSLTLGGVDTGVAVSGEGSAVADVTDLKTTFNSSLYDNAPITANPANDNIVGGVPPEAQQLPTPANDNFANGALLEAQPVAVSPGQVGGNPSITLSEQDVTTSLTLSEAQTLPPVSQELQDAITKVDAQVQELHDAAYGIPTATPAPDISESSAQAAQNVLDQTKSIIAESPAAGSAPTGNLTPDEAQPGADTAAPATPAAAPSAQESPQSLASGLEDLQNGVLDSNKTLQDQVNKFESWLTDTYGSFETVPAAPLESAGQIAAEGSAPGAGITPSEYVPGDLSGVDTFNNPDHILQADEPSSWKGVAIAASVVGGAVGVAAWDWPVAPVPPANPDQNIVEIDLTQQPPAVAPMTVATVPTPAATPAPAAAVASTPAATPAATAESGPAAPVTPVQVSALAPPIVSPSSDLELEYANQMPQPTAVAIAAAPEADMINGPAPTQTPPPTAVASAEQPPAPSIATPAPPSPLPAPTIVPTLPSPPAPSAAAPTPTPTPASAPAPAAPAPAQTPAPANAPAVSPTNPAPTAVAAAAPAPAPAVAPATPAAQPSAESSILSSIDKIIGALSGATKPSPSPTVGSNSNNPAPASAPASTPAAPKTPTKQPPATPAAKPTIAPSVATAPPQSSAPGTSYNPASGQQLAEAVADACTATGCNTTLMQQAFGGVCGLESGCNAQVVHTVYTGFGQLGAVQTSAYAIPALRTLAKSAQLSPAEQAKVLSVANAAQADLNRGVDPNRDTVLGPWLLVGYQLSIGSPAKISAATDNALVAAGYLEIGQIAPDTFFGSFSPQKAISPFGAVGLQGNGFMVHAGMSAANAAAAMVNSSAVKTGQASTGIAWMQALVGSAQPSPAPAVASTAPTPPTPSPTSGAGNKSMLASGVTVVGDSVGQGISGCASPAGTCQGTVFQTEAVYGVPVSNVVSQLAALPNGSKVVVSAGTNNWGVTAAETEKEVRAVLNEAQQKNITILAWVGPSADPLTDAADVTKNAGMKTADAAIKSVLPSAIPFIDLESSSLDQYRSGYHYTNAGYQAIDQLVIAAINNPTSSVAAAAPTPAIPAAPSPAVVAIQLQEKTLNGNWNGVQKAEANATAQLQASSNAFNLQHDLTSAVKLANEGLETGRTVLIPALSKIAQGNPALQQKIAALSAEIPSSPFALTNADFRAKLQADTLATINAARLSVNASITALNKQLQKQHQLQVASQTP